MDPFLRTDSVDVLQIPGPQAGHNASDSICHARLRYSKRGFNMDGYPAGSLDLNLPYIAVAGLSSQAATNLPLHPELLEQVIVVRSEIPNLVSEDATRWKGLLEGLDSRHKPWSPQDDDRPYRFRVALTGRVRQPALMAHCSPV